MTDIKRQMNIDFSTRKRFIGIISVYDFFCWMDDENSTVDIFLLIKVIVQVVNGGLVLTIYFISRIFMRFGFKISFLLKSK